MTSFSKTCLTEIILMTVELRQNAGRFGKWFIDLRDDYAMVIVGIGCCIVWAGIHFAFGKVVSDYMVIPLCAAAVAVQMAHFMTHEPSEDELAWLARRSGGGGGSDNGTTYAGCDGD